MGDCASWHSSHRTSSPPPSNTGTVSYLTKLCSARPHVCVPGQTKQDQTQASQEREISSLSSAKYKYFSEKRLPVSPVVSSSSPFLYPHPGAKWRMETPYSAKPRLKGGKPAMHSNGRKEPQRKEGRREGVKKGPWVLCRCLVKGICQWHLKACMVPAP